MMHETGTIDFLVGGIKSSPQLDIGKHIKEGVLYISGKAGDVVEITTEVAKAVYSKIIKIEDYFNKDRA